MDSGSKLKVVLKYILSAAAIFLFSVCSYAAENSVSSISVNKDNQGNIKVFVKTDKPADINKITDKSVLTLTVNSAVPADSADIIYDNTTGIQNITVQKKNTDNTVIRIQGENIENASIFNKDLSTGKTVEVNSKHGLFFAADKDILTGSVLTVFVLFALMLLKRPKTVKHKENKSYGKTTQKNPVSLTLRHKALYQTGNIPSINPEFYGKFKLPTASIPEGLRHPVEDIPEKIRKVG